MCVCTPSKRTPFCGAPGCEWPESKGHVEHITDDIVDVEAAAPAKTTPRNECPARAAIFAHLLPHLQKIARKHGYALAVHGSMATDFDLLACPWTEEATDAETLIEALRVYVGGRESEQNLRCDPNPRVRPHGRLAWAFYFDDTSAFRNHGPYLDISVMPRSSK